MRPTNYDVGTILARLVTAGLGTFAFDGHLSTNDTPVALSMGLAVAV